MTEIISHNIGIGPENIMVNRVCSTSDVPMECFITILGWLLDHKDASPVGDSLGGAFNFLIINCEFGFYGKSNSLILCGVKVDTVIIF
jgi:hypothetical protein